MDVSSVSNASFSRSVKPSNSSSDRHSNNQAQAPIAESKAQDRSQEQRSIRERLQQQKEESQRRLDGRLISYGQETDNVSSQQKQASFNRSRVNEAYSSPSRNEVTYAQNEQAERARNSEQNRNNEAIDIIV